METDMGILAKLMLVAAGLNISAIGLFVLLGMPGWALFGVVNLGLCLHAGWGPLTLKDQE
jgi:hypothetical protein